MKWKMCVRRFGFYQYGMVGWLIIKQSRISFNIHIKAARKASVLSLGLLERIRVKDTLLLTLGVGHSLLA